MMKSLFSSLNIAWGRKNAPGRKKLSGQSMVELALTTPILLLIVAGTVEVTNVITLYNTLQLATREGARLAAQGAPDATVNGVVLQSLSQTAVVTDPTQLNVWVIRPKLNATGTCATCWNWVNATGTLPWGVPENCITVNSSGAAACTGNSPVTASMVGTQLWQVPDTGMDEETFAIVVGRYNVQTLLNLRFWSVADASGHIPVYTYTVFRQEVSQLTAAQLSSGCSVYPIAINSAMVSEVSVEGTKITVPINDMVGGGSERAGFGFLAWRTTNNTAADLTDTPPAGSLKTPGNSQEKIPTGNTSEYYISPYTASIKQMRRGSWVPASQVSSLSGTILGILEDHRLTKRALRVILYDLDAPVTTTEVPAIPVDNLGTPLVPVYQNPGHDTDLTGTTTAYKWVYQISNFAVVRVLNTQNSTTCTAATCNPIGQAQPTGTVQFSFVKMDSSCGFAQ